MTDKAQSSAAPRVTLVDGDSLDYIDGKAVLTLHLDGGAARWFADNLPRRDGMTETFEAIAWRLGR